MQKYYVALSQDGQEIAIFNSVKLEISIRTIDNLNEPKEFFYKPFQEVDSSSFNSRTMWSLSISNKLENGDVLIALSHFNKDLNLITEGKAPLKRQSVSSIFTETTDTSESLSELENGEGEIKDHTSTWIFSTLNKERVCTTIDDLSGIISFLGPPVSSLQQQTIVIIHDSGITKTSIHLNYHQHHKNSRDSSSKSFFNKIFDENLISSDTTEFYFPLEISKNVEPHIEDKPQLKLFFKSIKKNYFFMQDSRLSKSSVLECYNLGGPNDGKLIKSFQVEFNKQKSIEAIKSYFYTVFNSIKNNMIIEISNNEKLLAYHSKCYKNYISLYLMENNLQVCSKNFTNVQNILYFQFVCNDEKLLIVGERDIGESQHSKEIGVGQITRKRSTKTILVFIVWDLFSSNSEEDSIKIAHDSLNLLNVFRHSHLHASSNGNIIYIDDENGSVKSLLNHPDLIDILKPYSSFYPLKPLNLLVATQELSGSLMNHTIYHLDNMLDTHAAEKEVVVIYSEPWIRSKTSPRISVFLNEEKSIQLIIGVCSVQVWRRSSNLSNPRLEYIWMSRKYQKIVIKSLSVERNEFLLELVLRSEQASPSEHVKEEEIIRLHWPHNVLILKDACVALEYCYYLDNDTLSPKKGLIFDKFRIQVENIVTKFIKYNSIIFQLSDIRYDIMGNLIRGNCVSIIKKILFTNVEGFTSGNGLRAMCAKMDNHLHFPRLYSWDSNLPKRNDLEVAIESTAGVNRKEALIVGYLLDYYSDNAMQNIGWMVTISRALPHLYNYHLDYYVKELFYKPCFYEKPRFVDESLLSPHELRKGHCKDVHSINIRLGLRRKPALIRAPKDKVADIIKKSKRKLKSWINNDRSQPRPVMLTKLSIVPLPDFFVYPNLPYGRDYTYNSQYFIWRAFKAIFLPSRYFVLSDPQYSPFLRVLIRDNNNITMFSNPSFAALVDYKWRKAQYYFIRHSLIYIAFACSFCIITNAFHDDDYVPTIRKKVVLVFQVLLFYLGYLKLFHECLQIRHQGFRRYASIYNFFDCVSVIMPLALVISLNTLDSHASEDTLRRYAVATSFTTLVMWIEVILILRVFSGPANYINISLNIISRVFYFFIFMSLFIVAFAHSMYILLRSPQSINLRPDGQNFGLFSSNDDSQNLYPDISINETFDVNNIKDNYFSSFWQSILAVYFWTNGRWDQLNQWNFVSIEIISLLASIILVTVMQNILIAFMSNEFDEASASGRQAVLKFRAELICDYETSVEAIINREDEEENPRNIYYVSRVEEVEHWENERETYRKTHKTILVDKFDHLTDEEESDDSDNEYESIHGEASESEREIKGKIRERSGSTFETFSKRSNRDSNGDEKVIREMKEIQDDMKNKMVVLEDKLEQVLGLLKTLGKEN